MTEIFVFGSNLAGRHGMGSAREAREHWGAVPGVGIGRTGQAYAIPTKDEQLSVLPLVDIRRHVERFREYAERNPALTFRVVAIGCGLAGYRPDQIAPMFLGMPENVRLPLEFNEVNKHA